MTNDLEKVVIIAGSNSDEEHIKEIIKSLETFQVPYETRICSAHKQQEKTPKIIAECNDTRAPRLIIAVASGTDALSGQASYHSYHPVVSCPPEFPDINESCLTNPPGSSNAYIRDPKNVGRFAAQLFSPHNEKYQWLLHEAKKEKVKSLETKDAEFREKYSRETYD